jgi:c-di-GMP-binding flagellar brake protein YcgR
MLLQTLDSLIRAGIDALQTTCGLTVTQAHVSMVGNGSLTFPALGELHIRNGTLQKVHLGCDTVLMTRLASGAGCPDGSSGLEVMAARVLSSLLEEMEGRRPRGIVENLMPSPVALHTRGQRTFGVRLETGSGRLFMLAEIPSKVEMEETNNGDAVARLIGRYLPPDWLQRREMSSGMAIDSFLVLARKIEADVFLGVSRGAEGLSLHSGLLLDHGTRGGQHAIRLCVDLGDGESAPLAHGQVLRASVGLQDRAFGFDLEFLEHDRYALSGDGSLPCAWFAVPESIAVTQRRRSFRMPLPRPLDIEVESVDNLRSCSPWGDGTPTRGPVLRGLLSDLSFEGGRVVIPAGADGPMLEQGQLARCHFEIPGDPEPVVITAVVRRVSLSLADRNEWQREIGLEFCADNVEDCAASARIRDLLMDLQRARLANRVHVLSDMTG